MSDSSAQDAALLCAQDPAAPLVIGAVARFDGATLLQGGAGLDLERIRPHIDSRLDRLPRFRQRLQTVAFDQGPPVWVDDAGFDIANHVRAALLRPARQSDRVLRRTVSQLLEEPLDPTGPLWELVFVHGPVRDDGTIEGDEVVAILRGQPRDGRRHRPARLRGRHPRSRAGRCVREAAPPVDVAASRPGRDRLTSPGAGRLWLETLVAAVRHDAGRLAGAVAAVTRPDHLVRDATVVRARHRRDGRPRPPALAISRPVGSRRDFAWLGLPLTELHESATRG